MPKVEKKDLARYSRYVSLPRSGLSFRVCPKRVREATYNAVLAALMTAKIRKPLTNPAAAGESALRRAIVAAETP